MAVKALLRIKLVITPMRAEHTVISSRTSRIWTYERNTRPQSLACHGRKCDLRAQLWRTRITLIGPDPSCPAADD
eukprot:2362670-Prymnesium_polylepis.1